MPKAIIAVIRVLQAQSSVSVSFFPMLMKANLYKGEKEIKKPPKGWLTKEFVVLRGPIITDCGQNR